MYSFIHYLRSLSSAADIYREDLLREIGAISIDRMLDIGCNNGEVTLLMAKAMGSREIHGIDCNSDALSMCVDRGITTSLANIDGSRLPFEDNSFDCCTCVQVIEHISDTDLFIDEVHRILLPGGYFIVVTPNLAAWNHIVSLFFGYQPACTYISDRAFCLGNPLMGREGEERCVPTKGHVRVFTRVSLAAFLRHNGFRVIRCIGSGYLGLPRILVRLMTAVDGRHATNVIAIVQKRKKR